MKKISAIAFFLLILCSVSISQTYTWNGSIDSDWGNLNNWTPSTGIPDVGDTAIINIASPSVELDANRSVHRLQMSTGTLHLKGFTLTVDSTIDIDGGVIDDGTYAAGKLFGDSVYTTDLQNVVSDAEIEIWSEFWGAIEDDTLNNKLTLVHFGGTNEDFQGRSEYNDIVTYRTINNRFRPDQAGSTFNGDTLYLLNHSPEGTNENIFFSRDDSSTVNGDISLEIIADGNIRFGSNGSTTGHVTLSSGNTVTCANCNAGHIYFDYFHQQGGTAQTITATDTCSIRFNQSSIWTGDLIVTAPNIYIQNGQFDGNVELNKTGIGDNNNTSTGNNKFNGNLTVNNTTVQDITLGSTTADTIVGNLILNATSDGIIGFAYNGANHYVAGTSTLSNSGSGNINIGSNAAASIRMDGNITMTSTGTGDIRFGNNGANTTFGNGVKLLIGVGGFTDGRLRFQNTTQADATNENLTLMGTSVFEIDSCIWNGILNVSSPQILVDSCTFNTNVLLEKTGANNNNCEGGNTFNGNTFITHSGSDALRFATTSPDDFNGNLTITSSGSGSVHIGYNSDSTTIDGNIIVSSSGSSNGIYFGQNTGEVRFGSGYDITTGGGGFSRGTLRFQNFRQHGNTAQNFTLTGLALLDLDQSYWTADIDFTSPRIRTDSSEYAGVVVFEKTGSSADDSEGANVFNDDVTITNSSTARLRFANVGHDTFLGNLSVVNSGSSYTEIGYNGDTTTLAGTLTLESTGSSQGIRFGENNGAFRIDAGQAISIGGGGFDSGTLRFDHTSQLGTTAQTLALTGSAEIDIRESVWNGPVDFTAPDFHTRISTYNNTVNFRKTGTPNSDSYGQNVFNDDVTIRNNGDGRVLFAGTVEDDFNGSLTLINGGTDVIHIGYNGDTTTIAGDIELTSTGSSTGTRFGAGNGKIKLENGVNITVGGGGYSSGTLEFEDTRQSDAINQTLVLVGSSSFVMESSHWEGDIDVMAPEITTRETVYNGTVTYEKTGSGNDDSYGGNLFNDVLTLTHSGSNRFRMANTVADSMAATVNLTHNGSGQLQAAFCENNLFDGVLNIVHNGSGTIDIVGANPASATFNGTINITNSALSTSNVEFGNSNNNPYWINADINATNLSTGQIIFSNTSGAEGRIDGNITLENTNGGNIRFGSNDGGSDTLKAGNTISIGGAGFDSGILYLFNFIQESATNQTLALTTDARIDIRDTEWDGDLTFSSPRFFTRYSTYNGIVDFTKNGGTNDDNVGGNIFNADATINHIGSNRWRWANTDPDTFSTVIFNHNTTSGDLDIAYSAGNLISGDVTANKLGAGELHFGGGGNGSLAVTGTAVLTNTATSTGNLEISNGNTYVSTFNGNTTLTNLSSNNITISNSANSSSVFNGNLIIENNNGGNMVFGNIGNGGSNTLTTGNVLSLGGLGFDSGNLYFRNFTQQGPATHAIVLTGTTTTLEQRQSSWDGDISFTCPRFTTRESTYNGPTYFEKTSTGNNDSYGDNVFNGATTIVQNGTGRLRFANNVGDDYNNDITYVLSNTGNFDMAYTDTNTYAGDVTTQSTSNLTLGENNGVVALDGAGNQNMNINGGAALLDLEYLDISRGTGTVTLAGANLRLKLGTSIATLGDRYFDLDGFKLTMSNENGNAITFNNGYFISEETDNSSQVTWAVNNNTDLHTIPFGDFSGNSLPFDFTRTAGNVGNLTVSNYGTPSNNTPLPSSPDNVTNINGASGTNDNSLNMNDRYWQIDISGTGTADIAIPYMVSEIAAPNTINESDLVAQRWEGTQWSLVPVGTVNTGTKKVEISGVSTFSPWVLVDSDDPLPVELIAFNAHTELESVLLTWTTITEVNNDKFIIERSVDGYQFTEIGEVNGSGNSNITENYTFRDSNPQSGKNYYRLIQLDFDGSATESNIVSANFTNNQTNYMIFPNPTSGTDQINIIGNGFEMEDVVTLTIHNEYGVQIIQESFLTNSNGALNEKLTLTDNTISGVYIVTINSKTGVYHQKLVVNK